MAKYLIEATYSQAGIKGVMKEGGTARRAAVQAAGKALGAKVEGFYFGFGKSDAYVTVDLPDNVTAAAIALTVNSAGGAAVKTTVLLTPEEVDEAAKRSVDYTPPGG
jgi:uncharacterized protein with GYD domain